MSSNPPYNSKLRSSKPKKAIIKPKPEVFLKYLFFFKKKLKIRKNCKLNSKISPKFSTNSSRIRCTNCKELLFSEDIEEHKENCTTNQKRCPYCQVFFPNRLIVNYLILSLKFSG